MRHARKCRGVAEREVCGSPHGPPYPAIAALRAERLSKSDRDAPDDFRDLFDLYQTLADGFELTVDEALPAKRGER